MFFHMTMVPPIGTLAVAWTNLCEHGALGVDVFFVLSGFLITGILLDTLARPHYFRNFYARRVLRIFPLYYAVLGFAFLILPRIAPSTAVRYAAVNREAIWYWLHLSNFAIARRGSFVHGILDVSWSLAIEEQFYLLWPALVWCVSLARLRWRAEYC
jgi:peptidoglycan/LPS O-acetylase OafA/YrhL